MLQQECIDVKFDEHIESEENHLVNIDSNDLVNNDEKVDEPLPDEYNEESISLQSKYPARSMQKYHPVDQIVGDLNSGVQTRRRMLNPPTQVHVGLLSMMEPIMFLYQ